MVRRVKAIVCGVAAMVPMVACTLTTDLTGYAGAEVSAPQEAGGVDATALGTDAGVADAMTMEGSPADTYRAVVLSDAPVAYWRLDDTTTVAKDQVGGHDGMYMGNVQSVVGAIAGTRASSFDGASHVVIGDAFGFTGVAPFTIEAWAAPQPGSGSATCMVAKDTPNDAGVVADGWAFYLGNSNELFASRWQSATQEYAKGPAVASDTFSHVVMTYDGKAIFVFANGVLTADMASSALVNAIAARLTIGASRDGTGCFYRGVLGEVAIYDRALSSDRVLAHYAAAKP